MLRKHGALNTCRGRSHHVMDLNQRRPIDKLNEHPAVQQGGASSPTEQSAEEHRPHLQRALNMMSAVKL